MRFSECPDRTGEQLGGHRGERAGVIGRAIHLPARRFQQRVAECVADLVTQLTQGASADVFASADTRNMDKAAQAGLLEGNPVTFAANTLTIAVSPGNPKGIKSFRDLTKPGVSVVVCAPPVPCGGATQKVEKATGVTIPRRMAQRRPGDAAESYADVTKAKRELHFEARRDIFTMCADAWRWQTLNPDGYDAGCAGGGTRL